MSVTPYEGRKKGKASKDFLIIGDIEHRLRGVTEEAQKSLEEGGETVLKKLNQLKELF